MRYEYNKGYFKHTVFGSSTFNSADPKPHIHDEYEIVYLVQGSHNFFVSGSSYVMETGDILLLRGLELHKAINDKINYVRGEILFTPNILKNLFDNNNSLIKIFDDRIKGNKNHIRPDEHKGVLLRALFGEFDTPLAKRCPRASSKIFAHFINLLNIINEVCDQTSSFVKSSCCNRDFEDVIRYIDSNIQNTLSLDEISRYFYVSPQHLIRLFKKYVGTTFHEYVICKKIIRAKELIKKGHTLKQSCKGAGFLSYSGYYRAFKSKTGMSPKEYAASSN